MDHSKTGHFRPSEYRTTIVSGIQMNPVFGCPVFGWLLYIACVNSLRAKIAGSLFSWVSYFSGSDWNKNGGSHFFI